MYRFTVKLRATECGADTTALVERIYSRANDATCGSRNGVVEVAFDRESASLEEALRSAITDLQAAGSQVSSVEFDSEDLAQLVTA